MTYVTVSGEKRVREFIDGAKAIARGAVAAGCNFFAGYPITPATPILHHMFRDLPNRGGVAIQGEDEISSIGMCIGAAMAGAKAMTATSGPGMSLYSENIGLAIMGEVPLVIVDVMRLGPATGGATTVGQGDVQFVRWGTSGGYPIIALCPTDATECYSLTFRAFKLAERFRSPVFLLTDREVVATSTTVDATDCDKSFAPYRVNNVPDVPFFSPFGGNKIVRFTGSTHDERGFITKNPVEVARLNEHLAAKIDKHRQEIETVSLDLQDGAEILLVGYGITARSILESVALLREGGGKVSSLIVNSLWPVPEEAITKALQGVKLVIVPELNLGQYKLELERVAGRTNRGIKVVGVNRVDGELINPQQIMEAII